jgi:hypothetical protein
MGRFMSAAAMVSIISMPAPAFAANFGFVRWPDWMDAYIFPLLPTVGVLWLLTVLLKPRGVPQSEMYRHFGEFSALGKLIYVLFGLSFVVLMAFVFIGMGMQRASE